MLDFVWVDQIFPLILSVKSGGGVIYPKFDSDGGRFYETLFHLLLIKLVLSLLAPADGVRIDGGAG
jgi:hypothetical protein